MEGRGATNGTGATVANVAGVSVAVATSTATASVTSPLPPHVANGTKTMTTPCSRRMEVLTFSNIAIPERSAA